MDNFDLRKYLAEGRLFKENVDFPELEDEFEGAMDAMIVEPEVYLQDIIDAPAEEIVSDGYYEIMNAVEQGVYSKDEAVKLAKAWAKEKLSSLAESRLFEENQSPKFKIGDFVQPKVGSTVYSPLGDRDLGTIKDKKKYIGQIQNKFINKPENLKTKDGEYLYSVTKLNHRGKDVMSSSFKESDLESIPNPTDYIMSLEPYRRRN